MRNWPASRRPINFSGNPLVLIWPLYRGDARQSLQWGVRGYSDIRAMVVVRPAPRRMRRIRCEASLTARRVPSRRSRQGRRPDGLGWQCAGGTVRASNFRIVDRDEMKIVATGDCGRRVKLKRRTFDSCLPHHLDLRFQNRPLRTLRKPAAERCQHSPWRMEGGCTCLLTASN